MNERNNTKLHNYSQIIALGNEYLKFNGSALDFYNAVYSGYQSMSNTVYSEINKILNNDNKLGQEEIIKKIAEIATRELDRLKSNEQEWYEHDSLLLGLFKVIESLGFLIRPVIFTVITYGFLLYLLAIGLSANNPMLSFTRIVSFIVMTLILFLVFDLIHRKKMNVKNIFLLLFLFISAFFLFVLESGWISILNFVLLFGILLYFITYNVKEKKVEEEQVTK